MIILATTFTILIAGVVIFLLITLLLVGILLYVKTKLTPEGTVEIDINDGKLTLDVEPGNSLLSTLGNKKVFLKHSKNLRLCFTYYDSKNRFVSDSPHHDIMSDNIIDYNW